MLLTKLNSIKLFDRTTLISLAFLGLLLSALVSSSYAQSSDSADGLPSIISFILNDEGGDVDLLACGNSNYQIKLVFPDLFPSSIVTSGEVDLEDIEINPSVDFSRAQYLAFIKAACFWQNIITEDNIAGSLASVICSRNMGVTVTTDGLRIFIDSEVVDGPGGFLLQGGPCMINAQSGLPHAGVMSVDSADLAFLESNGTLDAVIRHEMGHVLGIGALWDFFGLIQNEADPDNPNVNVNPFYSGPKALEEYRAISGVDNNAALFIENGFTNGVANGAGPGAINGHWAKTALGNELMTFQIESPNPPLSRVTIGSLEDMGYTVDYSQADNFSLPSPP